MAITRTAGFDGVLEELRTHPSPDFEHFALLQIDMKNERISLAVGGNATVELDGSTLFSSPGQTATTELQVSQVERIRLMLAAPPSSAGLTLPLADGTVRATTVGWSRADAHAEPVDTLPPEVAVVTIAPTPEIATQSPQPIPAPAATAAAHVTAQSPAPAVPDETFPPLAMPDPAPIPAPGEPPASNIFDQLFGQTRFRDVEAAALRDTGVAATEAQAQAETEANAKVEAQARTNETSGFLSDKHLTGEGLLIEAALDRSTPPALALILPDGTVQQLGGAILVGRKPTCQPMKACCHSDSSRWGIATAGSRAPTCASNRIREGPLSRIWIRLTGQCSCAHRVSRSHCCLTRQCWHRRGIS